MAMPRRSGVMRFPRVRGGGPQDRSPGHASKSVPPGARGWSPRSGWCRVRREGSPGCAGVVLKIAVVLVAVLRFPRVRGGGPTGLEPCASLRWVPPGARGWSVRERRRRLCRAGSPGCAGVVPRRGGRKVLAEVPPGARGWSRPHLPDYQAHDGSPGCRGWSAGPVARGGAEAGSPGCAGVVPSRASTVVGPRRFPRVRGGGPHLVGVLLHETLVPPGARGWSVLMRRSRRAKAGSPGCAGVVRTTRSGRSWGSRFPRVRGGGPGYSSSREGSPPVPPGARGWSRRDPGHFVLLRGPPGARGGPDTYTGVPTISMAPRVRGVVPDPRL